MNIDGVEQDDSSMLNDVLAVARRDALLLALAMGREDHVACCVAASHLRWSLSAAVAITRRPDFVGDIGQLSMLRAMVQRWDPIQQQFPLTAHAIESVVTWHHVGEPAPIDAVGGRLEGLDLSGMELTGIDVSRSLLRSIDLRNAVAIRSKFAGARVSRCRANAAELIGSKFDGAEVEFTNFATALLALSSWHEAIALGCNFDGVDLVDARIQDVVFTHCDFRGANFGSSADFADGQLEGVRFVHCDLRDSRWHGRDLRGACFEDCAFRGAFGASSVAGAQIVRPDLSVEGDGSQPGTAADVVGNLTARAREGAW